MEKETAEQLQERMFESVMQIFGKDDLIGFSKTAPLRNVINNFLARSADLIKEDRKEHSPLMDHTDIMTDHIVEAFPLLGAMEPKLKGIIIKDMNQFGLEVLAVHAKEVKEKMDPKLREMRLECLKLAAELGPVQYSKVGEQGVLCAEHLSVIDVAETYLKYVTDGPQGQAKVDDEYHADRETMGVPQGT